MQRRVPGERILERLEARASRRPVFGCSPMFYARFGLEDPWSAPGPSAAAADAPTDDLNTLLERAAVVDDFAAFMASYRERLAASRSAPPPLVN